MLLIIKVDAGQVRRQKVRGKLDPAKVTADGTGKGAQKHGLSGSGYVLQQHVAACDQADHDLLHDVVLSHDDLPAVFRHPFPEGRKGGNVHMISSNPVVIVQVRRFYFTDGARLCQD